MKKQTPNTKKMYIVKYYGGSYEDSYTRIVFVTDKKATATKYITRFNKILKKWKEHYSQYEERSILGFKWIKEQYKEKYFNRWYSLGNITKAFWEEVEIR
jgi:hypothetical protein